MDILTAPTKGGNGGEYGLLGPERASWLLKDRTAHIPLSPRERQVLQAFVKLATAAEVGAHLGISRKTVNHHMLNCYFKLDVPPFLHRALFEARARNEITF